ncbi:MAG: hypothetical protein JSS79_10880 [Bacteroidetes bacterium]|nr:hypothetical protein [Bacteroidota bacterium]
MNSKEKMTIKEYDRMIKSHVNKRDFVKIERTVTEGSADISGFILRSSKDFLLIQKEEEFYLNGYAIIRKDHFDSVRCNKFDKTFKKILKEEGILGKDYGLKNDIELKDWKTIFESLKKHDYHVIVECEDLKEPLFVIGPIKKINKDSVGIQYYSPAGLLDKKPTTIKYKDITLVKFDDRYINVFKKYLRAN